MGFIDDFTDAIERSGISLGNATLDAFSSDLGRFDTADEGQIGGRQGFRSSPGSDFERDDVLRSPSDRMFPVDWRRRIPQNWEDWRGLYGQNPDLAYDFWNATHPGEGADVHFRSRFGYTGSGTAGRTQGAPAENPPVATAPVDPGMLFPNQNLGLPNVGDRFGFIDQLSGSPTLASNQAGRRGMMDTLRSLYQR